MNSLTSVLSFGLPNPPGEVWWVFLAVAGLVLIGLTLWSYRDHREASRGRLILLLALRLLALVIALFTACRPSWKVEERPNEPSRLLIGIDMSRSMTVTDEGGGQSRIQFVRKILESCKPTLDELERQNCEVVIYAFGATEFNPAASKFDPKAEPVFERSDYAVFPRRLNQEWANEKYIRGVLIVGDGADNGRGKVDGKPLTPTDAAAEWKGRGVPIQTFAVGDQGTNQSAKDVAFADVVLDPDPVAIKNKFVVRARVNAFKMSGIKVPFKVYFDTGNGYEERQTTEVTLGKETNNLLEVPVDAPPELPKNAKGEERRQIKVKLEIPVVSCPGDTNANNNIVETYLSLNKEGVRVLVVDRYRYENALLIDALAADKRIDVRKVDLQTDVGVEDLRPAFDFEKQAYDVLIFGNVSPKQLTAIDPDLPKKIAERVQTKGMGFMMLGGHATLNGSRGDWGVENGWRGVKAIEDILPVTLPEPPAEKDTDRPHYMVVPEPRHADMYLTKIADTRENSLLLWERLNTPGNKSRFTGLNRVVPKQLAQNTTYLWAKNTEQLVDLNNPTAADRQSALLIGQQLDSGTKSRVLVFAAQDTYLWQRLGQPKLQDGKQLHSRFWRQLVLWLAKQDQEESNAFVRPEFPRLKVNDIEGLKIGIRGPNGVAVTDPKFTLTVTGPGLPEAGATVPIGLAGDGTPRAEFVPRADGEYTATLNATGKTDAGEVTGIATAKFLALPDTSEEMQRTTPDYDLLRSMAAAGGGTFHRAEDLPAFLTELKSKPYVTGQLKKKNIPDWRPVPSNYFLPFWMVVFALTLVAEWGLRRWWGMV